MDTHEILIADSILSLPEIDVELPLAELYDGIVFETEQDADRPPAGERACPGFLCSIAVYRL